MEAYSRRSSWRTRDMILKKMPCDRLPGQIPGTQGTEPFSLRVQFQTYYMTRGGKNEKIMKTF